VTSLAADARHAVLQRLADDLNVLAHADEMDWTCCYLTFWRTAYGGWRRERWGWRFCNGGVPGEPFGTEPCGHWHHQHEPPLLALG
jgi:hypothetical protein